MSGSTVSGAMSRYRTWGVGLVIVLVACSRQPPPPAAPSRHWVPVEFPADTIPLRDGRRDGPIATLDYATRYVLAELPTWPIEVVNAPVTATSNDGVEMTLRCPPELAGQLVALKVSGFPSLPGPVTPETIGTTVAELADIVLQAPASLACPADPIQDVTVPLRGLRVGMKATPTVVATAEPVAHVETAWFDPEEDGVLRLSLGLADPAGSGVATAARFRVRAENQSAQSVPLLDRVLDPAHRPADRGWVEERIPMAAAMTTLKSKVRLVLDTEPVGEQRPAFPVWGDPSVLMPVRALAPAKRNVILVSIDTLRADRVGAYGAFPSNSPHLDRLADEGTVFLSAFAAAPWTLPSHTTMLTGVRGCVHGRGVRWGPLGSGISPIAEILRRSGYSTAAFTEDVYLTPTAFQRGFGLFDAYTSPTTWGAKGDVERTVSHARAWVEAHADEPFFLFVHTYQVHAPYQAPPPFGDLLGGRLDDDLVSRAPEVQAWQDLARYDEEVRYTDSVLGSLFESVDRLGLSDRTIIVVTSDHGEAFGEHGHFGHTRTLDEEVIHVPFIWRAPGLIASGRRLPVVAGLADIVPTILDLLQMPIPPVAREGSLAAFLRDVDPPLADAARRVVFSERMLGSTYPIVARGHNWRAEFDGARRADISFVSGQGREQQVAATSPTIDEAMAARSRYEADCKRFASLAKPAETRPTPQPPSAEQLRALRALGYVQ